MGYSRDIKDTDLYAPLPEHRSNVLGDAMQKAWDCEEQNAQRRGERCKPSLWRVLFKVFGCELMLYGLILAAMEFLIRLQQPLFLGLLLRYYSPVQDDSVSSNSTYLYRLFSYYDMKGSVSWGEAVFFAFGIICCSTVNIMVQHPFMMGAMHMGMKMRVGVCSLIYRKALKVNIQATSESSGGLVLNLMANDVNRFDTGPLFAHYLWIGPLETMLMTVYLYREMGMPAVYGSLIILAVIPFQIFLGLNTAYYRRGTAEKSDERVRLMQEIIMGIEVIKMYTWEKPFQKIIDSVRRHEVFYIKMTSYIRGVIMSFIMFTSRFGIFITVLLYVTYVNRITVENVFFLTCYYNITKQTMTLYFPQAVGQIAEMNVAVQRIREYLLSEDCRLPIRVQPNTQDTNSPTPKKRVTIIDPATMTPTPGPSTAKDKDNPKEKRKEIRKDEIAINFENASSRWLKSSNKNDVLDLELSIFAGSLTTVIGSVGSGKSTLLHMVLSELPCTAGAMQVNGTVSYASQDPWLFVGSVRQNILFGQSFQKQRYMEVCKVCALERDISLFPHGDKTIIGERGVSLSGGQRARINLARAVYKEADIYLLDDPLSAVDTQVAKHIFERCIKRYLASKTVLLVTHQLQFIKSVDHVVIMDKGKIIGNGAFEELEEKELKIIQLMNEKVREVHEEENIPSVQSVSMLFQPSSLSLHRRHWSLMLDMSVADQKPEAEIQTTGRVRGSVYRDYFMAGAPCCLVIIVGFLFLLAQFCASACDYWISRWSNTEDRLSGDATMDVLIWSEQGLVRKDFVLIFGIITLATIIVALIRAFFFFSLCMQSSIKLHDQMFESISRSPMSFFHTNPSGRILNRFSKDMGAVDELLPQAMIDCFQIILNLLGVVIVILMTDITLLIPIAAAMFIFYIFRVIYIRTTGAVKRLEGITRSPVFGHVNATILGLATIRSFGAEFLLAEEFDLHQDLHSAAWYLFITCSRSFGYFLDLICLLFIICVTFSCLMKTDMDGSYVGLAITQSISLTGIFQWGMRQSAEMENQMTSVERVLEYTKLPQEAAIRSAPETKPPADWPAEGLIKFDNLSLKYSPEGGYVLYRLQFTIEPQEKIGIVGRTGAGKSSIIQALFRLAYLEGTITIDGVDIMNIGLHELREKLSIIPQMTSYIRGVIMSFIMFTSRFGIFITVLLYVTYVNRITVENVFFLTCYYNITKQTMTLYFPQAVGQIAEMNVAVQRIREYLLSEDCRLPIRVQPNTQDTNSPTPKKRVTIIDPATMTPTPGPSTAKDKDNPKEKRKEIRKDEIAINFENASSRWLKSSNKNDVLDLELSIFAGSLTTVIGSVGSGKSTLLHMVLSELPCTAGAMQVNGTVSYASQDPWLFVGSVRQNILFGQSFQKQRYMEVCKVCALERDISLFPHGDKTIIGERGVSLSGGQRARINLARAVYKEADIYLLDDPLSAVDTQVAKHIFERCIKRYLASKTVLLVTHQLQFIKSVDHVVIMDKGKIIGNGAFEELEEKELKIIQLMNEKVREVHEEENIPSVQSVSMLFQPSSLSLHRRHWSLMLDMSVADQKPEAEIQTTGRVRGSVYRDYFMAGAPCCLVIIVGFLFLLAQFCASACDYWISRWSNTEDRLSGDATMDVLIWSEQGLVRKDFVLIFGIITLATIIVALIRAFFFFSLCMQSSIKLHDQMFESISRSPMSFFHTNPSGRILNRFSKDMGAVDELLPQAMIDCFQIILNLLGVVIVILMTDITLLIPIAAAMFIFYIFRVIYIRTTGAVKRLEGITRSPVFGHVNATILGLATIRSFGAEFLLAEEFDLHQDLHSAAWYLFITCSRSFGYFLDLICLLFIICVTFSCLMKTDMDGSYVGLAITQSISLTGIFQWGMRQSAEMENQMTSVERVLEYTKLPQEAAIRSAPETKPPADWPAEGLIKFDNLSLKYSPEGGYVLYRLQFTIEPQEKIGIVGRTGAGKSSIIQALFRLAYLEGTITIDGVDIMNIGLHELREKLSIIPQEPVLFSGNIRKNLDPFDQYPDSVLMEALNNVELQAEGDESPLYKEVSEGGCNFSVGERQLVCLARAIVHNDRILVLDEATANVDAQTDQLIQTAIRLHFSSCTVLTVAHRLNTIIDSDKILVLDAGRLMEFDHPHILLQNKKGYFRKMVSETGPIMTSLLHKQAAQSYRNRQTGK